MMLSTNLLRFGIRNFQLRCLSDKANRIHETVDKLNAEIRNGGIVPVFKLAALFEDNVAIQDQSGEFTYKGLFQAARGLSYQINFALGGKTQKTVAYLCPNDSSHVFTQWGIWMSGNIAVPLSSQHPLPVIEYFLKDCGASMIICDPSLAGKLPKTEAPILQLPPTLRSHALLDPISEKHDQHDYDEEHISLEHYLDGKFYAENDALILYTSGTTSHPKGVVHGFKQLSHQISSLHSSWRYRSNDTLLHCLPMNHIHGQVVSMTAGLAAGARIRMMPAFSSAAVWAHFLGMKKRDNSRITVFMAVPTMYSKLIEEYDKVFASNSRHREYIKSVMKSRMRLMTSGSAPLPTPVFERWEEITGHRLLERYGMTEIGMALSNPYDPPSERTPGLVGTTLPGVSARLYNGTVPLVTLEAPSTSLEINLSQLQYKPDKETASKNLFVDQESISFDKKCKITYQDPQDKQKSLLGELYVHGPGVFKSYFNKPEQTKADFTEDGWFKTGDTAVLENGKMRIFGRTSIDIIKSGGYKISALEVETILLSHAAIADVAILGLPDPTWGEKVTAAIQLKSGFNLTLKEIQEWGAEFLPKYQLPTSLFVVPTLPRNSMGKVNKAELRKVLLQPKETKKT